MNMTVSQRPFRNWQTSMPTMSDFSLATSIKDHRDRLELLLREARQDPMYQLSKDVEAGLMATIVMLDQSLAKLDS